MRIEGLNSKELRLSYIQTAWIVLAGYAITIAETSAAIYLGLTSMSYGEIILPGAAVTAGTAAALIVFTLNKKPTERFGNLMFYLHFPIYFSMYALWIYRLNEIRVLGLFSSMVAVVFVMLFTTSRQSLLMSLGTLASYISASYYGIVHGGQQGLLARELFYTLSVFPAFIFLSFVARYLKIKTGELMSAKVRLSEANDELEKRNRELRAWQMIAKNDMELAAAIQRAMLPAEPVDASGWDIAVTYMPRQGISGDFYDFYYHGDVLRGIGLFDVSGHGISSGLLMMLAKPIIYRLFNRSIKEPLHRIMDAANRELSREIEGTHSYITGILVRFSGDSVEYVNAGHPEILLRRAGPGTASAVNENGTGFRGKPLGIGGISDPFKTMKFPVHQDDILLLYTDCLVEGSNSANTPFGLQRLKESLDGAPQGSAREILDHVITDFRTYIESKPMTDDFTVILAKRLQ